MTSLSDIATVDLLSLVGTHLKKVSSTRGGEYHGPCPKCGGRDRFVAQPNGGSDGRGLWMCRSCHPDWGDVIVFVEWRDGITFREACDKLGYALPTTQVEQPIAPPSLCEPPSAAWQATGDAFVVECFNNLWVTPHPRAQKAIDWLKARGISELTACGWGLGYNPDDRYEPRTAWGLVADSERRNVFLPRGIVIPWYVGDDLWRVNIRRAKGEPKYMGPAGCGNGLYNAGAVSVKRPTVLVEGEFDALLITQEAGGLVSAVATGSTAGARRARWYARLATAPRVFVAFDTDQAGEEAAQFWCNVLGDLGRRWRPVMKDPTDMWKSSIDLKEWVEAGLST